MRSVDLTNVQVFTNFRRPVGGFVVKIMAVDDVEEKEYLKVYYDIVQAADPNDAEFVGMYTKRKQERGFDYPSTIFSLKDTDGAKSLMKGICTALKDSNNGFDFEEELKKGPNGDPQKLVGKVLGVVLGDEEYMGKDSKGAPKVRVRTTVVARRSVDSILKGEFTMPVLKKLDQSATAASNNPFKTAATATPTPVQTETPNPFKDIPQQTEQPQEFISDEIPF